MKLIKKTILKKLIFFEQIVDGNHAVYNPISKYGLSVLNKESYYIYDLINGKRNISHIFKFCSKIDKSFKYNDLFLILKDFIKLGIIYLDGKELINKFIPHKPKVFGVWLHITNKCNLRCKYCYICKSNSSMSLCMGKKVIRRVFEIVRSEGYKNINLKFSGGEPILKFNEIIKLVKYSQFLSLKFLITTNYVILSNGTLITQDKAKLLKQNNISVGISLDGLKDYNDKQRIFADGSGSFSNIITGIQNLQKEEVEFSINITITKLNVKNIPAISKFLLKKKIPFLFSFVRDNLKKNLSLMCDNKTLIYYLKKSYKIIEKDLPKYSLSKGLLDSVSFRNYQASCCGVGKNYLVINYNGNISSCQMLMHKPIGNIFDQDIIKILKNKCFVKAEDNLVDKNDSCRKCIWRYMCFSGCPLLRYYRTGKFNVKSPYCSVYKALIPEVIRLETKRIIKNY